MSKVVAQFQPKEQVLADIIGRHYNQEKVSNLQATPLYANFGQKTCIILMMSIPEGVSAFSREFERCAKPLDWMR